MLAIRGQQAAAVAGQASTSSSSDVLRFKVVNTAFNAPILYSLPPRINYSRPRTANSTGIRPDCTLACGSHSPEPSRSILNPTKSHRKADLSHVQMEVHIYSESCKRAKCFGMNTFKSGNQITCSYAIVVNGYTKSSVGRCVNHCSSGDCGYAKAVFSFVVSSSAHLSSPTHRTPIFPRVHLISHKLGSGLFFPQLLVEDNLELTRFYG